MLGSAAWSGRSYDLGKMSLRDLVRAYLTYPAIQVYMALGLVAGLAAVAWAESVWPLAAAVAVTALVYPLVWYALHRWVLHGSWLYKSRFTAALWKRIHFDHHQDPHRLEVLFGSLANTLPTIAIAVIPIGWAIGGQAGAAAALCAGLFTTCVYEFCHCIQHLSFKPKNAFLKRIKQLHLAHHFHNENGNYGITNYGWDRLLGTFYAAPREVPRSPTVFNLGYDEGEAERYPWVAALSEEAPRARPRTYRQGRAPGEAPAPNA